MTGLLKKCDTTNKRDNSCPLAQNINKKIGEKNLGMCYRYMAGRTTIQTQ